ncbi:hypothetical protein O0A02_00465 [Staphylococcus pseudintermedius]|nr:hypothetical protein [Staphylococcus pseudintermedius]MDK3686844.1 hypothetical protein [Staphylococcus pseudintermedius]MDK3846657.1 hypothetical protein [Staphylococcus pseudintermedius]
MTEAIFVFLINALLVAGVTLIRQIILTDSLGLVILYQIAGFTIIAIGLGIAESTRYPNHYTLITVFLFVLIVMDARNIVKKLKKEAKQ